MDHAVLDPEVEQKLFRVGYLFYYATEVGLREPLDKAALKMRLNSLMADAVILANRAKLDVLNSSSMMDNALFLKEQMFNVGTGYLYYYISNYRVNSVRSGMNEENQLNRGFVEWCGGDDVIMVEELWVGFIVKDIAT
jgi:glycylpeptide N-tetradecanoyltransferase